MPEDRSPIKHEAMGDDWYAIIVLPQGDHWTAQVTLTDMSPAAESHFGRVIFGPVAMASEDEGWARAEEFMRMFQELRRRRPEYTVLGTSTKDEWKHVAQASRNRRAEGYHWFIERFPLNETHGVAETVSEGFTGSFGARAR